MTIHRELFAVDCSQVATPAEFWVTYGSEVPMEGAALFGKNLDALRDALSAGGPGWPGPSWIELHNTERLAEFEGVAFMRALEQIEDELAAQDADARLVVVKRGAPPRGRLYQHPRLRSRQLSDTTIARALRWQPRAETCQILWLKPEGRCWQRMFIDAGFAVWEECSDAAVEEELEELQDELVAVPELIGQRITLVQFDTPRGWIPEIRIEIASGIRLRIYPEDASDHESDSLLEVSQAAYT